MGFKLAHPAIALEKEFKLAFEPSLHIGKGISCLGFKLAHPAFSHWKQEGFKLEHPAFALEKSLNSPLNPAFALEKGDHAWGLNSHTQPFRIGKKKRYAVTSAAS